MKLKQILQEARKPNVVSSGKMQKAELMPIEQLKPFISEDRSVSSKTSYALDVPTDEQLPKLTQKFSQGEPIQEPIELSYDPEYGTAFILDGNTRLQALIDAQFDYAPVLVRMQSRGGFGKRVPKPISTQQAVDLIEQHGFIRPSDVGFSSI